MELKLALFFLSSFIILASGLPSDPFDFKKQIETSLIPIPSSLTSKNVHLEYAKECLRKHPAELKQLCDGMVFQIPETIPEKKVEETPVEKKPVVVTTDEKKPIVDPPGDIPEVPKPEVPVQE